MLIRWFSMAALMAPLGLCGGCSESGAQFGTTATILLDETDVSFVSVPTVVGDRLFFFAADADLNREPWVTDGTAAGTFQLAEIYPGPEGSAPTIPAGSPRFVPFKGHIYFMADDGLTGAEIWRTDGTPDGTELFMEIVPGPAGLESALLRVTRNRLYVFSFPTFEGPRLVVIDVQD